MNGPSHSMSDYSGSGVDMSFINYFYELATTGPVLVNQVLTEMAQEEESALKEKASQTKAWQDSASGISVSFSGESIDYGIDDEEAFYKNEYGDMGNAPNPLFRTSAIRAAKNWPLKFEQRLEGVF